MKGHLGHSSWIIPLVVCALGGAAAAQPAAAEQAAARQWIASRPELAAIAKKLPARVAAGVYRVDVGGGVPPVFLVKQGSSWVGALALDLRRHDPSMLLPPEVIGDARARSAFVVIGATRGTLTPRGLAGEIETATRAFGRDAVYQPGVNVFTQIDVGTRGVLGELRAAGLLPGSLWVSGSVSRGFSDAVLGSAASDSRTLDFSLTIAAASWVPPPFAAIRSPKLTLGDTRFTVSRTGGRLAIAGEQTNGTLDLGGRTFAVPRTTFTFTAKNGSYEVAVTGSSAERQPWRNAFGLAGVDLEAVTIGGTIAAARAGGKPKIQGFGLALGGRVVVNRRRYEGEFSFEVANGRVKEIALGLTGDLDLGFLPGGKEFRLRQVSIALAPGANQAALAGELAWRGFTGKAAVVLAKTPMLFVKLDKLDLLALMKIRPAGATIPPLDVLLAVGFGGRAGEVSNLPSAAQELIDEVRGTTGGKIEVGTGLTVLGRVDARAIGFDKLGASGTVVLGGSIDLVAGSLRLSAALSSMPAIRGLPRGFAVESPEVFVAIDRKTGAPTVSFGMAMQLKIPIDRQTMVVRGSMTASTMGTFSFTGSLESDWVQPLGLDGVTIVAPVAVTVGVSVDGSVDLGFQGGVKIARQTFSPMAMCLNIQPAVPTPVPKKLALRFAGSEFGPTAQLSLVAALFKSITNGPLKGAALDASTKKLLAQLGNGVDQIGKLADGLPAIGFRNVDVALTTPGVKCELPALAALGMKLKGTAVLLGKELGTIDSEIDVSSGLRIKSRINDLAFLDLVRLEGASIDVLAPIPGTAPPPSRTDTIAIDKLTSKVAKAKQRLKTTISAIKKAKDKADKAELEDEKQDLERTIADLQREIGQKSGDVGHFYLNGKARILGASASLAIELDRTQASFDLRAGLWDFGMVNLSARTEGENLAKATDFEVELQVTNDFEKKMFDKLTAALRATAAARKKAQVAIDKDTRKAQRDAQAEFDKLDGTIGKDVRKARQDLERAKTKFRKAERDLDKAKAKCKKDLGPVGFVCGAVDGAKETVKATKKSLDAAKAALKGLEKGAKYGKLVAAEATLASLKAGKDLVKAGLAGWAAIDNVVKLVVDGAAKDLISIEEIELQASLRKLAGSLEIKASVGDVDIEHELEVKLGPAALDIGKLAEKLADEIMAQATREGSAVWNALRKKK